MNTAAPSSVPLRPHQAAARMPRLATNVDACRRHWSADSLESFHSAEEVPDWRHGQLREHVRPYGPLDVLVMAAKAVFSAIASRLG